MQLRFFNLHVIYKILKFLNFYSDDHWIREPRNKEMRIVSIIEPKIPRIILSCNERIRIVSITGSMNFDKEWKNSDNHRTREYSQYRLIDRGSPMRRW